MGKSKHLRSLALSAIGLAVQGNAILNGIADDLTLRAPAFMNFDRNLLGGLGGEDGAAWMLAEVGGFNADLNAGKGPGVWPFDGDGNSTLPTI